MENISGEETARLLRRFGTVRTVPKGTLLSGKEAYWLLGGICALTCVNESGSQYSFLYFHRNMLFGFVPVLGRYYRMNRLVDVRASRSFSGFMAKTDCSVIELPANAFLSEITRDREVLSVVLRAAVVNLADMLNHSMVIASLPVPCRVCYMLLEACPEEEPYLLPAYLNYDEIAAHLGVHVITVTSQKTQFPLPVKRLPARFFFHSPRPRLGFCVFSPLSPRLFFRFCHFFHANLVMARV